MGGGQGQSLKNGAATLSREHSLNGLFASQVKGNLPTIVVAYILEGPRTGRELMDDIFKDTGVRLSPGRVYPLLRSLEKRSLLVSQEGARQVVYRAFNRGQAEEMLRRELEACAKMHDLCKRLARIRG
ncbi:MAG: PadR family transcriptional regulator [Halobacteria archaeon]